MKKLALYVIFGILFFCCPSKGLAILSLDDNIQEDTSSASSGNLGMDIEDSPSVDLLQSSSPNRQEEGLTMCSDVKLGVRFLCNPDWTIETETNVLLIIIRDDPSMTMTITKTEFAPMSLDELTMPILKEIGSYADGFYVRRTTFSDRPVIEVRGVSEKNPDLQMRDYYFINNACLYGVLFSVDSKKVLAADDSLIQQIMESFVFDPALISEGQK